MENMLPLNKDMATYKDKLAKLCRVFNRPPPRFETYVKQGTLYSQVSVGALAVNNHNHPGSASMAESQGKAAYVWLTTFPNTWNSWIESSTPSASDCDRPLNLVGQLNSAEKRQDTSSAGSNSEQVLSGTPSSSVLKLKPMSMLVQTEVKGVQSCIEDSSRLGSYPDDADTRQVRKPLSSWSVIKLGDFLKKTKSGAFWGSSFVLLVISGVETATLNIQKAALMLGVDIKELVLEMEKLRNEEKAFYEGRKTLSTKYRSEVCIRELGDCEESMEADKLMGQACDQGGDTGERGVKRRASSQGGPYHGPHLDHTYGRPGTATQGEGSFDWITGEVVAHLLKRSFALKDKLYVQDGRHPVLVLRISWPFYESNVVRVVKEIEEYCGSEAGLLMDSLEVQDLLKAAKHLDCQRMEGGGYALAPAYNYSRCMLEKKANYWETGLPALLLRDVNNRVMPAELAACQLGVTTSMIFSALCVKRLRASNTRGPVTVQRYKKFGFGGEEDFWKEQTTLEMLQKVREREVTVETMSAEWGVSRAEIVRRCGAVKSDQELEDERKLRELEKFEEKVQKAGFVKKESTLEKQIAQAEKRMGELSEYEKMRLENMKERQALLEQLDIDQERKEIAEERQKSMIFTPKEEVKRRAPSARVKALKEQKSRLPQEQKQVQRAWWVSPKWVGQWLPINGHNCGLPLSALKIDQESLCQLPGREKMKVEDMGRVCTVPRGKLQIGEILEQHSNLHNSHATLESIVSELEELVLGSPDRTCDGTIAKMEMENESVVSTSTITSMNTCWDFVGFGTAEGGVGVHIGANNIRWRPHNAEVTGIAFSGGSSDLSILSVSLDGAVRRSDLVCQSIMLEYKEEEEGISCLVKRDQSEFLLGCDSTVRLMDLRQRRVSSLLRQGGFKVSLHPTDPHMLAVGARIYDLRQPKNALLVLQSQVSSLQWSPISGEHLLAVGYRQANVYSTEHLLRGEKGLLLKNMIAEPLAAQWSPWAQASLLLSDPSRSNGRLSSGVPMVTEVGLDGKDLGKLELKPGTHQFLLCCHPSSPRLIVANSGYQGGLAFYK